MNRRDFLKTIGLGAVVLVVPGVTRAAEQDDTARLQAMLDQGVTVEGQTFRVSVPLNLVSNTTIRNCTFVWRGEGARTHFAGPVGAVGLNIRIEGCVFR